jgi:hypothetical protein
MPPTTTTPSAPEASRPDVAGLPSLALASATRALRITAILVLLAAVTAGGAAVRGHRAGDASPPNSADERAYLTLAHDLVTTGGYGNPGMN